MVISATARMDGGQGWAASPPAGTGELVLRPNGAFQAGPGTVASTSSSPVAQPCPSAVHPEVNVLLAAPPPVLDLYPELPPHPAGSAGGAGLLPDPRPLLPKAPLSAPPATPMPGDPHNHKDPSPHLWCPSGHSGLPTTRFYSRVHRHHRSPPCSDTRSPNSGASLPSFCSASAPEG